MADERIDIEIVDKVSSSTKNKINEIAAAARSAHSAIEQLKEALAQINTTPFARLVAAEAKLTAASAKLADANAKASLSQQRLATEVQRTAAAEARAETATLRLKNAQEKAAASANKSSFSFGAMKGQIIGVVAALGSLWAAFKLADDFANLENRLRSTGLEGDGLNEVMQRLQDSANNTRSSLVGTVELYSRLAISSKELGVSQNELIGFTTSLNQAILLSGANANEAQAGLIQLSQGMASGVLRGDELRSVLEQLPAVADVIAKSMGVTRGELRQMGTDGKITAQTILKAFKEAGPELGERFAGQVTTGSQALGVLHNKALEIAGEEGKGSLNQVAKAIVDVAVALEDARPVLGVFLKVVESTVKILRIIFLGVQSFFSGVLPLIFAEATSYITAFSNTFLDVWYNIAKVGSVVLPDSWGKGLTEMIAGLRSASGEATQYFDDMKVNAIDRLGKISETIASVYAPNIERAGKIADLDKKGQGGASVLGSSGYELSKNKNKVIYEAADIADAFSQINDELNRMEATLGKSEFEIKMMDFAKAVEKTKGSNLDLAIIRERLELYYEQAHALEMRNKLEADALARQDAILSEIESPFAQQMKDLAKMAELGKISGSGRQTYIASQNSDLFAGTQEAQEAQVRSTQEMYDRISALRNANDISTITSWQMLSKAWAQENETRLNATSNTLDDMSALMQLNSKNAFRVGKAFAVAKATIDGLLAVQSAFANNPPPYNYFAAAAAGVASAVTVTKIQSQTMSGFEVGGYTGNIAKNQIAGVVHGNEYVMDSATVNRLGVGTLDALRSGAASVQQNYTTNTTNTTTGAGNAQSQQTGTTQSNGLRIINVIDPAMIGDFMQSSEGEAIFINAIRNNSDTVKSVVNM